MLYECLVENLRLANHRIFVGLEWPRLKKLSCFGNFGVLKLIKVTLKVFESPMGFKCEPSPRS